MDTNIGLIKIYIENDIFNRESFLDTESEKLKTMFTDSNILLLEFNIENNTVEDFVDYLEFSDLDKCYIITNNHSLRLQNILEFIQKETDIETSIHVNKLKDVEFIFSEQDHLSLQNRINNSYLSINSGFYSIHEKVNIKHLYLEKFSDIKKIDNSFLRNFSLNSLIITDDIDKKNDSFSKVIMSKEFIQNTQGPFLFKSFSYEEIKKELEFYLNTGEIMDSSFLIKDLGRYLKNKKINSLFIKDEKIYYDSEYSMLLSDTLDKNIFEVLNNLINIPTFNEFPDGLIFDFYLTSILKQNNTRIKRSVSKFTTFNAKYTLKDDYNEYDNWLGYISNENDYYLYNKLNNKTFKINETFMEIYEYLVKSDQDKLNLLENNILNEAKELLNNAQ